jgi:Fic family protein
VCVPVLPDVANMLEKEVVASSIFGTDAIEGGTLSLAEVEGVLETPEEARAEAERRVQNLKAAYGLVEGFAEDVQAKQPHLWLVEDMFTDLHRLITDGLTHPDNVPGEYRNNPKNRLTKVGDAAHGGVYQPPKCLDDIKMLMTAFVRWANSEPIVGLPPLIRAPLIHYYFERIHPFWDGNGRVGRAVEVMVLLAAGYKLASWTLARYYLDHIDEFFAVFRQAEKADERKDPSPNTPFVAFFLEALRTSVERLHDRVNNLLRIVLFENAINDLLRRRAINSRQHTILMKLPVDPPIPIKELRAQAWYEALYDRLTTKTRDRDLRRLSERDLIRIDKEGIRVVRP